MSALCLKLINAGGYIILNSYYASKNLIKDFRERNLHLITRVRISTVGKCPLAPSPLKRGRPRIWGESVKLRNLFDEIGGFTTETLPQIIRKIEACERFVLVNAIALAILQLLSLEMPNTIWKDFPRWFRTLPSNGYPSEQIVRLTLVEQREQILAKSRADLLLTKFLLERTPSMKQSSFERFVT